MEILKLILLFAFGVPLLFYALLIVWVMLPALMHDVYLFFREGD